jgi:DNA polymerase-3 subunit gamma/tau
MYQALYRRFRPKTFDQVLGQEHITTTLKNQIINGNIGHAYLFTGTRGTGKTSTAKIFARAVNCLNPVGGNPCNECDICKGILDESIMDVIEMDAASNNSVDDVRELREKVKYPPSKSKYKVYIIDEVHMLSKGAFNALLKTLEEPPAHLIFILATTEVEKLPQTILSRCQRFDFRRVTTKDIMKNMRDICSQLDIEIDDEALNLIARSSDGAMRDALSLLDQCISFSQGELSYDNALQILGLVGDDYLFNLVDAIIEKNLESALEIVDEINKKGKDINQFINDLIYHFRNLMIAKNSNSPALIIDAQTDTIKRYTSQAEKLKSSTIMDGVKIFSEAENQSKWSSQPRIILEMSIIKLMNTENKGTLEERIERIENILRNGDVSFYKKDRGNNENKVNIAKPEKKIDKKKTDQKVDLEKEKSSEETQYDGELNLDTIKKEWPKILNSIKKVDVPVHVLLMDGKLKSFKKDILTIAYRDEVHKEAVNKKERKECVEKIISRHFGREIRVEFITEEEHDEDDEESDRKLIKKVEDFFGKEYVEIKK